MPKGNLDLNLSLALNTLDSYILRITPRQSHLSKMNHDKDEKKITPDLKKLNELRNRIYKVLYPVENDFYLKESLQSSTITTAKKKHLQVLNSTFAELKNILKDFFTQAEGIDQDFRKDHQQILDKIFPHIKATLFILRQKRKTGSDEEEKLDLEKSYEKNFYSGKEVFHQFANSLDGIYYPINQYFDPFQGMSNDEYKVKQINGICFGYVQIWAQKIADKGKSSLLFKNDAETFNHHKNQSRVGQGVSGFDYTHIYEIEEKFGILLSKISTEYVYRLVLNRDHAAGIRKIPHSTKIEYFDPNFGLFVFPDAERFKIWFSNYFLYNYFKMDGRIHLYRQQDQPIHATPSIPDITIDTNYSYSPKFLYEVLSTNIIGSTEQAYSRVQFSAEFLSRRPFGDEIHKKITEEMFLGVKIREKNTKALVRKKLGIVETKEKDQKVSSEIKVNPVTEDQIQLTISGDKKYIKSSSEYGAQLIQMTQNALQAKIEALEGKEWEPTKLAFIELKKRIENAECFMTLTSIINNWLSCKPLDEKDQGKTYGEIIQEKKPFGRPRANSLAYQFITDLKKNYEINPVCNTILQEKCLLKIAELGRRDWSNLMPFISGGNISLIDGETIKRPVTFKKITQLLTDYQASDDKEIHIILQSIVDLSKKSNNFIVRFFNWRSQEVADLYSILQKLNINNPSSLENVYTQLVNFEVKFNVSFAGQVLRKTWETIGIFGGGYLGGTQGALLGAFFGTLLFPGIGTLVGTISGAVIGSLGGGVIGSWLSNKLRILASNIVNLFSSSSTQIVHQTLGVNTVNTAQKTTAQTFCSTNDIRSKLQIKNKHQPEVSEVCKVLQKPESNDVIITPRPFVVSQNSSSSKCKI